MAIESQSSIGWWRRRWLWQSELCEHSMPLVQVYNILILLIYMWKMKVFGLVVVVSVAGCHRFTFSNWETSIPRPKNARFKLRKFSFSLNIRRHWSASRRERESHTHVDFCLVFLQLFFKVLNSMKCFCQNVNLNRRQQQRRGRRRRRRKTLSLCCAVQCVCPRGAM